MAKKQYAFYPGCSSQKGASAANFATSIQLMNEKLDIQLNEIPDWNCCGASIGYGEGSELQRLVLNARNLALAETNLPGQDLVSGCPACWLATREAAERLHNTDHLMADTNEALKEAGWNFKGRFIVCLSSILSDDNMEKASNQYFAELALSYLARNIEPVISVEVSPGALVEPGTELTFDLHNASDRDGEIVSYKLSASDGTSKGGTSYVLKHTFMSSGTYDVELSVEDDGGAVSRTTVVVKVNMVLDATAGSGMVTDPKVARAVVHGPAGEREVIRDGEYVVFGVV